MEVGKKLKEAREESDTPSELKPDIKLEAYTMLCLERMEEEIEEKTVANYRQLMFAHVLSLRADRTRLGKMPVRDIRLRHVKSLVARKRKQGYAKDSVRLMRSALSSILTDAVEDEIIAANPVMQFSSRKKKKADKLSRAELENRIQPMNDEELQAFIGEAKKEKVFGMFFVTLAKTGCRPSEAIALVPGDIKRKRRTLRIEKVYASKKSAAIHEDGRVA